MTDDRSLERAARSWIEIGPTVAPERAVEAALVRIQATPQERDLRVPRRIPKTRTPARIAVAAVVGVLAIGGTLFAVTRPSHSIGSPVASPTATPTLPTSWTTDASLALTVRRDPLDRVDYYWVAATYDRIHPTSLEQTDVRTVSRPADSRLLQGTADDPSLRAGQRIVSVTIIPAGYAAPRMVSPAVPVSASENVRLTLIGDAGFFGALDREGSGSTEYTITARVQVRGTGDGELSTAALRAAGTDYPVDVRVRYLALDPGTLGPNATLLRDRIVSEAASTAPVDIADHAVLLLRSSEFTYMTDLRQLDCHGMSVPECFATYREGYCLYYATTMAVILRDLGIPTRVVEGFRPGSREAGVEEIRNLDASVWVEVYFPGYGWVTFDPTGVAVPGQTAPQPTGAQ